MVALSEVAVDIVASGVEARFRDLMEAHHYLGALPRTLTAGVGGSMLSVGSAAGVVVMGTARGVYTFLAHLKWSWAIAIGYGASIGVNFLVNGHHFQYRANICGWWRNEPKSYPCHGSIVVEI